MTGIHKANLSGADWTAASRKAWDSLAGRFADKQVERQQSECVAAFGGLLLAGGLLAVGALLYRSARQRPSRSRENPQDALDPVDVASRDSFPCSDPPGYGIT